MGLRDIFRFYGRDYVEYKTIEPHECPHCGKKFATMSMPEGAYDGLQKIRMRMIEEENRHVTDDEAMERALELYKASENE